MVYLANATVPPTGAYCTWTSRTERNIEIALAFPAHEFRLDAWYR